MRIPEDIVRITSDHNTSARTVGISYIAVHYTAGYDSRMGKARDNAYYYAQAEEQASADFFVDEMEVVQYNPAPEKRYCWAVGGTDTPDRSQGGGKLFGKSKNGNVISVEICSRYNGVWTPTTLPNDPGYELAPEAVALAEQLVIYLMREFDVSKSRVIRHFDVTGKLCPGVVGYNEASGDASLWKAFKAALKWDTTEPERFNALYELPAWAKPTIRKLIDKDLLQGNGGPVDVNGRPADLDLSLDMIRGFVVNDRAGCYGE